MRKAKRAPFKRVCFPNAKAYNAHWRALNREHVNQYARNYAVENRRKRTNLALASSLRCRLNLALRQNNRAGSAVADLGCSLAEFRIFIEGKFASKMSWDNWGIIWQLDHIKPLGSFNLSNREQFLEACHFTNYQPLFWEDHHRKSVTDRASIRISRDLIERESMVA